MILEKEVGITEMLNWLQAEMTATGIMGRIARERIRERREAAYLGTREIVYQFVLVPVFLEAKHDGDYPSPLVKLETAWNDQEPAPEKRLFLYPGQVPDGVV